MVKAQKKGPLKGPLLIAKASREAFLFLLFFKLFFSFINNCFNFFFSGLFFLRTKVPNDCHDKNNGEENSLKEFLFFYRWKSKIRLLILPGMVKPSFFSIGTILEATGD